jgi:hypothetical protein
MLRTDVFYMFFTTTVTAVVTKQCVAVSQSAQHLRLPLHCANTLRSIATLAHDCLIMYFIHAAPTACQTP